MKTTEYIYIYIYI